MKLDQFDYELPEELIAQYPLLERTSSKLLYVKAFGQDFLDLKFLDLINLLHKGDLLVLNDTKVVPARLFGYKESGGKIEFLLERMINNQTVLVQLKASKSPKIGTKILFPECVLAEVVRRQGEFYVLKFKNHATSL